MPLCSFEGDASLFASTPVENLFLQEFMLGAPGDYVKVYLYGLMQAHYPALAEKDLNRFAASLGLERGELDKALDYWQKRGLLQWEADRGLRFVNVRSAVFGNRMAANEDGFYEFAAFSNRLEELAQESGRPWKKKEPGALFDLLEDGFEEEAVFLLLRDALKRHGKNMTSARLNALMQEWRQKNLRSPAAAREEILGVTLRTSPANGVLVKLGITQRKVSEAEHREYEKWTGEWGFDDEAIFAVLQDMTGVQNPNFNYLGKVLDSTRRKGQTGANDIRAQKERRKREDQKIRDFAYKLGANGRVTDSWRNSYHRWTQEYGLTDQLLLALAEDMNAGGIHTFKEAEDHVMEAARQELQGAEGLKKRQEMESLARRIHERMGLRGKLTAKEVENVGKWLTDLPEEVLLYGADCAADANKPLGYLARVLGEWQRAGVRNVQGAEEEQKRNQAKYSKGKPAATTFEGQRRYGGEREKLVNYLED